MRLAIQADEALDRILPFRKAGLNVHFVDDLAPFQIRKVRILNGAHTLMAPMGILRGFTHVRAVLQDVALSSHIRAAIDSEIIPSLTLDSEELRVYAETVWQRFGNPFIEHRLLDISMNGISKFRTRVLPTVFAYAQQHAELPASIVQSWAELIRLYKVRASMEAGGSYIGNTWQGKEIVIRDDPAVLQVFQQIWESFDLRVLSLRDLVDGLLTNTTLWGQDLSGMDNLRSQLCSHLEEMEGVR